MVPFGRRHLYHLVKGVVSKKDTFSGMEIEFMSGCSIKSKGSMNNKTLLGDYRGFWYNFLKGL